MISNPDFLCHAFHGCGDDETPWVAGFPGDVANAPHHVWFGASAFPLPVFIRDRHNNYVCISTFKRGQDGHFRRRKDCWSGLWLVLFDDLGTKIPHGKLLLKPSWLVETSPGNFQAWLMLKTPERNYDKAEALINGLITSGASDPGAGNLTRYGRLPVGSNGKALYIKNGKPFTQRVHSVAIDRRYSIDEIAEAYGINLAPAPRHRPRNTATDAQHGNADNLIQLLEWAGLYQGAMRGRAGGHHLICPWHQGHTSQDTTGTAYWSPCEENNWKGGFLCHHGHCKNRNIHDLNNFVTGLMSLREEKRVAA